MLSNVGQERLQALQVVQDGRLHYAGRVGTGMTPKELKRLAQMLAPLQVERMPLTEAPPRDSRFGSPLQLSRVH